MRKIEHEINFSSFEDFLKASRKNAREDESSHTGSPQFTGTRSYNEAVELARKGWPEGRNAMEMVRSEISTKIYQKIQKQEVYRDVAGAYVDVGAFLSGEPENMMEFHEVEKPGPRVVKLAIKGNYNCNLSKEKVNWWGVAVLALIDSLEYAGTRVEIDWVASIYNHKDQHTRSVTRCNIKQSDEALDVDRLAFMLGHPSMLRRLWFGVAEGAPDKIRRKYE